MTATESIVRDRRVGPGPRRPAVRGDQRRALIGTASVATFLAVWQAVGSNNLIRSDLIFYPSQVLATAVSMAAIDELGHHALVSLQELVLGFAPAVALGMLLGLLMGQSRRLRYLLEPAIMAAYATPRIALIPVLVLWFGIGMESKVAVVFLGAVFPILVNTLAGVQQIDPLWVRAARAFGAGPLQVMATILLPGALPAIMAGLRLGLGRAIIGVIVAEMYVSLAGVGRLLQAYGNAGRTPELIALGTTTALVGVLGVTALRWVELRVGPWRRELES